MAEKMGKNVAKCSVGLCLVLRDKVPQCDAVKGLRESKMSDFLFPNPSVAAAIYKNAHSPWVISALFLPL